MGSVAFGLDTTAWGNYSIAMGDNSSASHNAVALGLNVNAGYQSVAIGTSSSAVGNWSVALGVNDSAIGLHSFVMGFNSASYGDSALASGYNTLATGNQSASFNFNTNATSLCSVAMGVYNVGGTSPSATTWVATDPLFEIGNGGDVNGNGNPAINHPSDAFVVYKNGSAACQGPVSIPSGGDIPMFGN